MDCNVALLSNINMNYLIKLLKNDFHVYENEGYGNELGILLNPDSSYNLFQPDMTFIIIDLMELIQHQIYDNNEVVDMVKAWFSSFASNIHSDVIYYIGDSYLWGEELGTAYDKTLKKRIEQIWDEELNEICVSNRNVRIFPYHALIERIGEAAFFSEKTWYLGKILHTSAAAKQLYLQIRQYIELEYRTPYKALLLDLDNTLWGGLAGENENTPITLSDDKSGLIYKNLQRVLKVIRQSGVILGIVSKNNEADALEIIRNHPHMVLREDDFSAMRINWDLKSENIKTIAKELNIGLDSIVFWDDNPTEREIVRQMIPEVAVPDFPDKKENLPSAMCAIYHTYFEKAVVTDEDRNKAIQYADNVKRNKLKASAKSFDEYLSGLKIRAFRVDEQGNIDRLHQLLNKTNQFNLTTQRYGLDELDKMLHDFDKKIYLYRVTDCFGDNGIVFAAIADVGGDVPIISDLVMSCRVMGKNIEYALLEAIEDDLRNEGFHRIKGKYKPTSKNMPVEDFYGKMGYQLVHEYENGVKEYFLEIDNRPKRNYIAEVTG
mgnify:CR=1 FL=1